MQTNLRSERDGDRVDDLVSITDHRISKDQFEVDCASCGGTFFADKMAYASIRRAIEQGIDNPFLCSDCEDEYDELAYSEH